MGDRDNRDYEEAEGSLDPSMLYTKEYCIGSSGEGPYHVRAFGSATS